MSRSEFAIGELLYGIPSCPEAEQYHPEGERLFVHDGYVNGDGYGVYIGWSDHEIKYTSGSGNFMFGGSVRKATDAEKVEFVAKFIEQLGKKQTFKCYSNG